MTRLAVIGAGSWGTALAVHLGRLGHRVSLYCRDPKQAAEMQAQRCNRAYLPDISLPETLHVSAQLESCVTQHDGIVAVTPSSALPGILPQLHQHAPQAPIIWASKGFAEAHQLMSQALSAQLPPGHPIAMISGPTFAGELARGLPTAIVAAAERAEVAADCAAWLHGNSLRVYPRTDLIGVQIAAALKNIYAIAAGISDGLNFGANARAALITRALAEMTRLGVSLGADVQTFQGLAGTGDLLMTCIDDQSRNRRFGLALGRGLSHEQALREVVQVVEGVKAIPTALHLCQQQQIDMPLLQGVHAIIHHGAQPETTVRQLMQRELRWE